MKLLNTPIAGSAIYVRYALYAAGALALAALQVSLFGIVDVAGITPDALLIYTVWIALREGRFVALFAGFVIGIIFDFVTLDIVGTNALAKLLVAFIAGSFYEEGQERKTIGSIRFPLIVFASSVAHNLVYFFFYIKPSEISYWEFFLKYGLSLSFYTTVISLAVMLLHIPKREINR
ncbi:MAG: rod shape-determining protein MreD [Chloroflexota bacterium]